jgi:hypothetical protein
MSSNVLIAAESNSTALVVAVIGAIASIIVAVLVALWTGRQQDSRLKAERSQEEARLKAELRTEFMAEEAIHALLMHEKWRRRTFATIKKRIGGFSDDELRQYLVRSGAIRGESRDDGEELWGLRSRNSDWLE